MATVYLVTIFETTKARAHTAPIIKIYANELGAISCLESFVDFRVNDFKADGFDCVVERHAHSAFIAVPGHALVAISYQPMPLLNEGAV